MFELLGNAKKMLLKLFMLFSWGRRRCFVPRYNGMSQADILYAFYDLAVSPATFNIVEFLVPAEMERRRIGCHFLHVVIVPGPDNGFRADNFDTGYDVENKRWRLKNILVPSCWMFPSCNYVTVCASREEAMSIYSSVSKNIFPTDYNINYPVAHYGTIWIIKALSTQNVFPAIEASETAITFAKEWISAHCINNKVITITLRESTYELERNSDFSEWGRFLAFLDKSIYCPVIIRDTESAFKPLPKDLEVDGCPVFYEAPWNLEIRSAIYEISYLNMGVSNGPMIMCIMNQKARFQIFKLLNIACGIDKKHWMHFHGISSGENLPWCNNLQELVWEDDTFDVLKRSFLKMVNRIEKAENAC